MFLSYFWYMYYWVDLLLRTIVCLKVIHLFFCNLKYFKKCCKITHVSNMDPRFLFPICLGCHTYSLVLNYSALLHIIIIWETWVSTIVFKELYEWIWCLYSTSFVMMYYIDVYCYLLLLLNLVLLNTLELFMWFKF